MLLKVDRERTVTRLLLRHLLSSVIAVRVCSAGAEREK